MLHVLMMPIAAISTQYELMGDDERFKKRVEWQGEVEESARNRLDELLNQDFLIVDVQQTSVNNYQWMRYTLHKKDVQVPADIIPQTDEKKPTRLLIE